MFFTYPRINSLSGSPISIVRLAFILKLWKMSKIHKQSKIKFGGVEVVQSLCPIGVRNSFNSLDLNNYFPVTNKYPA